jgi:endonuclease III
MRTSSTNSTKGGLLDKKKTEGLIELFQRYYPEPKCALNYSNPGELLIATILSAQCTDERVNLVTEKLFVKYKSLGAFAKASLPELEQDIHSTGFYKNKAKNIIACAQVIMKKHGGDVPKDLESLVQLAGVGRKTANVVLGNAFQIASGVVVDTHVSRLSQRMNLTRQKTPEKIEVDLQKLVPKKHWINFSHWLILHGRAVCKARKPVCNTCFLDDTCAKRL